MEGRCKQSICRRRASMVRAAFLVAFVLLLAATAGGESGPDESISLEATNQPLSKVLQRLSQITGYRFTYNEDWADVSISVRIVNQGLDKALRRILGNFNHAILYRADGTIRIMIYDEKGADAYQAGDHQPQAEYGFVGSAAVEKEDLTAGEDVEERETDPASTDSSEGDRGNETEEPKE